VLGRLPRHEDRPVPDCNAGQAFSDQLQKPTALEFRPKILFDFFAPPPPTTTSKIPRPEVFTKLESLIFNHHPGGANALSPTGLSGATFALPGIKCHIRIYETSKRIRGGTSDAPMCSPGGAPLCIRLESNRGGSRDPARTSLYKCCTRAGFSSARRARRKVSGAAMAAIGQKGLLVMFGTFASTPALLYATLYFCKHKGRKR
jgi:hypothetical protein